MLYGKIILLCGKICSGKSTYARRLKEERNAVILSCDTLMLSLFDEQLGERHGEIAEKCSSYLCSLAEEIAKAGSNVILDFGFWTSESRAAARAFFGERGLRCELHYIFVSDEQWERNIEKRNRAGEREQFTYFIDENMKTVLGGKFREPLPKEIDVYANET
ncbi:MAG: ATP-binding protein [Oscillospiraceae bacterium]|jgi:predicted kinase|nr:ATP-binding protein [Oscillospiraceae bacterium]